MTGRKHCSSHSKFYYALRMYLHRSPRLLRLAFMLRGLLVLGPLRTAFVRYYKRFPANKPTTDLTVVFPDLNADEIVECIEEHGYARVSNLPETYLNQILAYCDANNRVRYWNPHKDCEAVECISRDSQIVEIARKYLGVEPILWLTELKWTVPRLEDRGNFLSSGYIETENYAGHSFHYDIHDVKSLTLFVYFTDVDMDSCPHVLIEGTHKHKTLKQLKDRILDDEVAQQAYGNRVAAILGTKGTAFLEDTTSFHKVANGTKSRLMLSLHYVVRRRRPPEPPSQ